MVVLGLGNPGPRYAGTRHNIGHRVVACLAERWGVVLTDRRPAHVGGAGRVADRPLYLALSRVYMNLSGEAARGLANRMNRQTGHLIVVHDDMDLAIGRVRIKVGGGDGGHRGIRSVAQSLGDREFFRIRTGVGRPPDGVDAADHVLARFVPAEADRVRVGIERAADAVTWLVRDGLVDAQGRIHGLD